MTLGPQHLVVPPEVWQNEALDVFSVVVWGYLAMRRGKKAKAWPNVKTIATETRISERKVRLAIAALETHGLVTVERRRGAGNRYVVTAPSAAPHASLPDESAAPRAEVTCKPAAPHAGECGTSCLPSEAPRAGGAAPRASVTLPRNPSKEPFQGTPPPPRARESGSPPPSKRSRPDQAEEGESPGGGSESEPANHRLELQRSIDARVCEDSSSPRMLWQLLHDLSTLHCRPDGAPIITPPIDPSAKVITTLERVIAAADPIARAEDLETLALIAEEWLSFLALVDAGECHVKSNPLGLFAARFSRLREARDDYGVTSPPPRGVDKARRTYAPSPKRTTPHGKPAWKHGLTPVSSDEEHERDAARPLPAWMSPRKAPPPEASPELDDAHPIRENAS